MVWVGTRSPSGDLDDLARADAAGAGVDALDALAHARANALEVRMPGLRRLDVGVADVPPDSGRLLADLA